MGEWWDQIRSNLGFGDRAGEQFYGDDQQWYLGRGYTNFMGDFRDYFTNWRGDLIAQEQNDLARQTFEHQQNMDLNGTQIRAEDYRNAGLSPYALAPGATSGQGSSLQAPQLTKPGRAEAMREGLTQMIQFGAQLAQIGKTKAETEAIQAQTPGHWANSQVAVESIQDRIDQYAANLKHADVQNEIASYTAQMGAANVAANDALRQAEYYESQIRYGLARYGTDGDEDVVFTVRPFNMAQADARDLAQVGYLPNINVRLEWFEMEQGDKDLYVQAIARQIALAEAQHNLEYAQTYEIRTNQTSPLGMLLENATSLLNHMFNGSDK